MPLTRVGHVTRTEKSVGNVASDLRQSTLVNFSILHSVESGLNKHPMAVSINERPLMQRPWGRGFCLKLPISGNRPMSHVEHNCSVQPVTVIHRMLIKGIIRWEF